MLKLTVALLACLALASGHTLPAVVRSRLGDIMMQSRSVLEENPGRASDCFSVYIPQINAEASKYEAAHATCLSTSETEREALNTELSGKRADVTKTSSDMCATFTNCNAKDNASDFFECYVEASNEATKTAYSMGVAADEVLQYVKRRYADIDYTEKTCTSAADDEYVKESNRLYTELTACLSGQ